MLVENPMNEWLAAGYTVSEWSNGPGDSYSSHAHRYRKLLACLQGSIVFHLSAGDVHLSEGDRLELEAGTVHSATVGPAGVRCAEAHVS